MSSQSDIGFTDWPVISSQSDIGFTDWPVISSQSDIGFTDWPVISSQSDIGFTDWPDMSSQSDIGFTDWPVTLALINKTKFLNDADFIICLLYKYSYWSIVHVIALGLLLP